MLTVLPTSPYSIPFRRLSVAGSLLCVIFGLINMIWLYPGLVGMQSSPILWMVGLFLIASVVWLFAIHSALSVPIQDQATQTRLLRIVFLFAVSFRAIQISVPPILELDLYRYMWDGITVNQGVTPYRFSPADVLTHDPRVTDPQLEKLIAAAQKSSSHQEILSTIHFGEYTTIYPPVSQVVFAATMWCVPDTSSLVTHLTAMKFALTVFDLFTLWLTVRVLRETGMHVGWSTVYGWSPLVIKEIANSGHLDSIAVCLTTAAIYVAIQTSWPRRTRSVLAASLLSLGTAAKLYPLLLLPAFTLFMHKGNRQQKKRTGAIGFVLLTISASLLLMTWQLRDNDVVRNALGLTEQPRALTVESKNGLTGFMSHWRMNDLIFSFIFENAKPSPAFDSEGQAISQNTPWYVWVPQRTRDRVDRAIRAWKLSSRPAYSWPASSPSACGQPFVQPN